MKTATPIQSRLTLLLLLISLVAVFPLDVLLTSIPQIASHFNTAPQVLGAQLATFAMIVALGQLLVGPAADRWGLKPVFLGCGAITLLATVGILFATQAWQFQWLRGLQALGCAGYGLSHALVQVQLAPAARGSARVVMTTASGVFISMAPLFGALLQALAGWRASFLVYALLVSVVLQGTGRWPVLALLLPALVSVCGVCLVRPAATCLAMDARPDRPASAAATLGTITFVIGGGLSWVVTTLLASGDRWLGHGLVLIASASCVMAWLHRRLIPQTRLAT